MTRNRINILLMISILLLGNLLVVNQIHADNTIVPKIGDGEATPQIDGNISAVEWKTSVSFTTTLSNQATSIYVTTNSSHLFIGFNMTSTGYMAVNNTVPLYNSSIANYTLGYNNQTHDWFSLVLDNNLDKEMTTTSIGTATNPDDAIVIDQYVSGAYDAFTDGNTSQIFTPDNSSLTYTGPLNSTTISGSNGTNNVDVARNITSDQVIYEIMKPFKNDEGGHDFLLDNLGILQFKLLRFHDAVANATLTTGGSVSQSDWFSLRINETGTGMTTQNPENTTINVIHNSLDTNQLDNLVTAAGLYGYDVTLHDNVGNGTLDNYDLNIVFVAADSKYTADELSSLTNYIRDGGHAIFMLGGSDASKTISEAFNMEYLKNQVLTSVNTNETQSQLNVSDFSDVLKFASGDNPLTTRNVSELYYSSSALNVTKLDPSETKYILSQEYMLYNLMSNPANSAYDNSGDGFINDTESMDGLSLGVAFDFLKGGRASIIPSSSLATDSELYQGDNLLYLLRMLSWNAGVMDTLQISSVKIDKNELDEMETATITVNMTDGLGNSLNGTPSISAEIKLFGNAIKEVELKQIGNSETFQAKFSMDRSGFMTIEITGSDQGYGFAEGNTLNIFVNADVLSFNDLSQINPIIAIMFGLSLIMGGVVYARVKKYI